MLLRVFLLIILLSLHEIAASPTEFLCGQSALGNSRNVDRVLKVAENHGKGGVSGTSSNTTSLSVQSSDDYHPLRVGIFVNDLVDKERYCTHVGQIVPDFLGGTIMCTEDSILTEKRKGILISELLPAAISLHEERLLLNEPKIDIIVPEFNPFDPESPCGLYSIPSSHHTEGVTGYDFILYVSSVPSGIPEVVAWATPCAVLVNGRPVVGIANIVPEYIGETNNITRVVAHEIAHALGFGFVQFLMADMVSNVSDVRGKPWALELTSPKVISAGAAHFGYPEISGVELEDEGGAGTAYSHWKRRNLKNELMAGVVSNTAYYTALTLAVFEDLGFYKANYSKAEVMPWGYNSGSKLLNEKCASMGKSAYPDMFCTSLDGGYSCTNDRLGMGPCSVTHFIMPNGLPSYFRYFTDPRLGGASPLMDYCPIIYPIPKGSCITGNTVVLKGSLISENSRCLTAVDLQLSDKQSPPVVCASVKCNGTPSEGTYKVQFLGASEFVDCPEGSEIEPHLYSSSFSSGKVVCPSYLSVCSNPENPIDTSKADREANAIAMLQKKRRRNIFIFLSLLSTVLVYI